MYQISHASLSEIEIKKSRFIGQLYPITSKQAAQAQLAMIRADHPNAVHVCSVLLCTGDSSLDDDGEPSGSAAKPIYNVLVHKQLFNILAVVVRYWGGSKLGVGGLTRAYGQAISQACKVAIILPMEIVKTLQIAIKYADEANFRHHCQQNNAEILHCIYTQQSIFQVQIKASDADAFERSTFHFLKGEMQSLSLLEFNLEMNNQQN